MSALSDHYGRLARMTPAELEKELIRKVFGKRFDEMFGPGGIIKGNHDISKTENTTLEPQREND